MGLDLKVLDAKRLTADWPEYTVSAGVTGSVVYHSRLQGHLH
jgi:hypothetical protein